MIEKRVPSLLRQAYQVSISAIILILATQVLRAQEPARQIRQDNSQSCPRTIAAANAIDQLYKKGAFAEIIADSACVQQLFDATKSSAKPTLELLTATESFLHLFSLSCIAVNKHELAFDAASKLLERFPAREIDPNVDPPAFRKFLEHFVAYPTNLFGAYFGGNVSVVQALDPQPIRTNITPNSTSPTIQDFMGRPRYEFGLQWQHQFLLKHGFITGIGISNLAYRIHYASREFSNSSAQDGDWSLNQYNKYTFLQIPIAYQFRMLLVRAYSNRVWIGLEAGAYGRLLLNSETELLTTEWETEDGIVVEPNASKVTIVSPFQRSKSLSGGLSAGVSILSNFGRWRVNIRGGAQWGLTQLRRLGTEHDPQFQQYIWQYHLSDQNLKLHSFTLSMGVLIPRSFSVKQLDSK